MLTCLRVRHLAIIDELELELGPGLNVVTGETGAGKSILVTALQLVLGARARPEVVRTGCERAEVEALFSISGDSNTKRILEEEGLDQDAHELVLRRVIRSGGGSRALVNGRLATLAQLRRIAGGLVDISSQHEHTTLVDAKTHLGYLDSFGQLVPLLEDLRGGFESLVEQDRRLQHAQRALEGRGERESFLRYQLHQATEVSPAPGELESVKHELDRIQYAERLSNHLGRALVNLDGEHGVLALAAAAHAEIERAERFDTQLSGLLPRLSGVLEEAQDVALDLRRHLEDWDTVGGRGEALEERYNSLKRVLRPFGGDHEAFQRFISEAEEELEEMASLEDQVGEYRAKTEEILGRVSALARELSERRRNVAGELSAAITGELADLGMGDARVHVEVGALQGATGRFDLDGARLSAEGVDRAEFLIAPNPGESPRPLAKVASGGELSRALLALKSVLLGLGPVAMYVFDEVDTGVGGAIAEAIGRKIRGLAEHHQVFCITHQPQIAAFGHTHLHVHKSVDADGRTRSQVTSLRGDARELEMARMLAGARVTAEARAAAASLLDEAGAQ